MVNIEISYSEEVPRKKLINLDTLNMYSKNECKSFLNIVDTAK